jgi:cytosine/adenosine deaminase-related metal-dependent hydrolase
VGFVEIFGVGGGCQGGLDRIAAVAAACEAFISPRTRPGLQPHAPYSCAPAVYRAAAATGLPLATHLAETPEEIAFTRSGTGPLVDMLRRIGVWNGSITAPGLHPVDLILSILEARPILAAHLNYLDDGHVDRLAASSISVAYCPRASAYFGHPHEGHRAHRYREMLARGVNVALGTDSMICLDTPGRISVLDDMRFLHRRDATDARTLLRMATLNGARALGWDESLFTFAPGPVAGVLVVDVGEVSRADPLATVLHSDSAPRWLLGPWP